MSTLSKIKRSMTLAAVALAFAGQVNAQASAGNEKAHNWQDKEFAPDVKNGAMHLRFGNGGLMSGIALNPRIGITIGNPSCDLAYLFYIKSSKKIPPAMREECAFNEYKLANLWTYEATTALANSFTKAKVLETYLPQVDARMAALSQATRFYIRADVYVERVDPATMIGDLSFRLTLDGWQVRAAGSPVMLSARGSGIGTYEPRVQFSPTVAQLVEEARVSRLVDGSRAEVYFDITSVLPAGSSDRIEHLILIENVKYRMFYYTKNKEYRSTANF